MLQVTKDDIYVGAVFTQRMTSAKYHVGADQDVAKYQVWREGNVDTCIGDRATVANFLNSRNCYGNLEIISSEADRGKDRMTAKLRDIPIMLDFLNLEEMMLGIDKDPIVVGVSFDRAEVGRDISPRLVMEYFECIYGYPIEVVYVGEQFSNLGKVGILTAWQARKKETDNDSGK